MSKVVSINKGKKSKTRKYLTSRSLIPNYSIVKKTKATWFDKALKRIDEGKEPFESN